MASLNKVFLIGNVTRDLELRYIPNGKAVLDVPLAVNEYAGGKEATMYVDVTFWDKKAETLSQYAGKGSPLFIEGRLKLERWDKGGQSFSKLKVVGWDFQFLGSKQGGQAAPKPPPLEREPLPNLGLSEGGIPF